MTAGPEENALAAQALAGGMAAAADWQAHAEAMQASIAGSQVEVSDAGRGPEDGAVLGWTGSDTGHPPGPSLPQTRDPNVTSPLDNRQSQ